MLYSIRLYLLPPPPRTIVLPISVTTAFRSYTMQCGLYLIKYTIAYGMNRN